jgi:hypothetical protein
LKIKKGQTLSALWRVPAWYVLKMLADGVLGGEGIGELGVTFEAVCLGTEFGPELDGIH